MFLQREPTPVTTEGVLEALSNAYDREILALSQEQVLDAQQIMDLTGMPKSTVYRRVQRLQDLGLLRSVGGAIRDGHAVERYGSAVEVVGMEICDGEVRAMWRRVAPEDDRIPAPPGLSRTADRASQR